MSDRLITKSIRLSEDELGEVAKICDTEGLSESSLMRRWVQRGIYLYRLDKAVQFYRDSGMSLGQAIDATGVTYQDLLDELARRKVPVMASIEQLDRSVQTLADVFGNQEMLEAYLEAKRQLGEEDLDAAS